MAHVVPHTIYNTVVSHLNSCSGGSRPIKTPLKVGHVRYKPVRVSHVRSDRTRVGRVQVHDLETKLQALTSYAINIPGALGAIQKEARALRFAAFLRFRAYISSV